MSALPQLPVCYSDAYEGTSKFEVWIQYQLIEYGALCRKQALEEAAQICEMASDTLQNSTLNGVAEAIRSLK